MNKKLIKTLACVSCGLGIVSSIPFMATSCGCSQKDKALPDNVYKYQDEDKKTILKGFKDNIDWSKYTSYDTMLIPSSVNKIAENAFYDDERLHEIYDNPVIPCFLKTLKFANKNENIDLGSCSFAFNSFENIYLPNKFDFADSISNEPFQCSQNLKHIYLNEKTQSKYVYSRSFGSKCQVIVKKNTNQEGQTFAGVAGGLATGFIDFTKDKKITQIARDAFIFCSSINGVNFSKDITEIGIHAFGFCNGLDPNLLSFEDGKNDNGKYGFATNLGNNAKFLVPAVEKDGKVIFEYDWNDDFDLVAGDIDYTHYDSEEYDALYFTSVSSVIFNSKLKSLYTSSTDPGFLCWNKQLKSITFKYGENQNLNPCMSEFLACPNLKYIEFNGYSSIDDFKNNRFILNEDNKTCFDHIARGGKIKASDCGFSSDELLEYLKDNTQSDWNPFSDWQAA